MNAAAVIQACERRACIECADAQVCGGQAAVLANLKVGAADSRANGDSIALLVDLGEHPGIRAVEDIEQVFNRFRAAEIDGMGLACIDDLKP